MLSGDQKLLRCSDQSGELARGWSPLCCSQSHPLSPGELQETPKAHWPPGEKKEPSERNTNWKKWDNWFHPCWKKKSPARPAYVVFWYWSMLVFFPSRDICPVTLDADIKREAIMAKGGGMFVLKVFIHQGRDTVNRVSWWCVSHKCTSSKKPS